MKSHILCLLTQHLSHKDTPVSLHKLFFQTVLTELCTLTQSSHIDSSSLTLLQSCISSALSSLQHNSDVTHSDIPTQILPPLNELIDISQSDIQEGSLFPHSLSSSSSTHQTGFFMTEHDDSSPTTSLKDPLQSPTDTDLCHLFSHLLHFFIIQIDKVINMQDVHSIALSATSLPPDQSAFDVYSLIYKLGLIISPLFYSSQSNLITLLNTSHSSSSPDIPFHLTPSQHILLSETHHNSFISNCFIQSSKQEETEKSIEDSSTLRSVVSHFCHSVFSFYHIHKIPLQAHSYSSPPPTHILPSTNQLHFVHSFNLLLLTFIPSTTEQQRIHSDVLSTLIEEERTESTSSIWHTPSSILSHDHSSYLNDDSSNTHSHSFPNPSIPACWHEVIQTLRSHDFLTWMYGSSLYHNPLRSSTDIHSQRSTSSSSSQLCDEDILSLTALHSLRQWYTLSELASLFTYLLECFASEFITFEQSDLTPHPPLSASSQRDENESPHLEETDSTHLHTLLTASLTSIHPSYSSHIPLLSDTHSHPKIDSLSSSSFFTLFTLSNYPRHPLLSTLPPLFSSDPLYTDIHTKCAYSSSHAFGYLRMCHTICRYFRLLLSPLQRQLLLILIRDGRTFTPDIQTHSTFLSAWTSRMGYTATVSENMKNLEWAISETLSYEKRFRDLENGE